MSDIIDMNESHDQGKMILLYGPTGVGKTTSILQTVPAPALYIPTEPRNPKISLKASGRQVNKGELDMYKYGSWFHLMEMLNTDIPLKYSNIILDSLTYLMNVRLSNEIEDEIFDAQDEEKKQVKTLINSTKMSQEGFGGLSSQMSRLIKRLGDLSKDHGINIILTALDTEHPKWNRELSAAPALTGQKFPDSLPGFLDLIGYVQPRINEAKEKIFPPAVWYECEHNEFLCKYTGPRPKTGLARSLLDLESILGMKKKGE